MRLPGPRHGTDIIVILVIIIIIIVIIIIALVVTGNRRIFGGVVAAGLCVHLSHRMILWRAEAGGLGLRHSVFGARVRRGRVELRKHGSKHPHWQSIE